MHTHTSYFFTDELLRFRKFMFDCVFVHFSLRPVLMCLGIYFVFSHNFSRMFRLVAGTKLISEMTCCVCVDGDESFTYSPPK